MTASDVRPGVTAAELSDAGLAALPPTVDMPNYAPAALRPGVGHPGVGGFHRAHQAVHFDGLAHRGLSTDRPAAGTPGDGDRTMAPRGAWSRP